MTDPHDSCGYSGRCHDPVTETHDGVGICDKHLEDHWKKYDHEDYKGVSGVLLLKLKLLEKMPKEIKSKVKIELCKAAANDPKLKKLIEKKPWSKAGKHEAILEGAS